MKLLLNALVVLVALTTAALAQSVSQSSKTQDQTPPPTIQERTLGRAQPSTTGAGATGLIASEQGQCREITVRSQESPSVAVVRTFFRCD